MAISIEHISSTKKQCIATFTSEEFKLKYQEKFKQFKPKALIDGFRPGKISNGVIEKKYGLSLKQEALDDLLQSAWTQILDDNKFEPIAQPQIDIKPNEVLKHLQFNEELVFSFTFEINSEYDLIALDAMNLELAKSELTEEKTIAFERHVARLLSKQNIVDRPAALKDIVNFDAIFIVNGEENIEKNVSMLLDSEESNEDFVKNIVGHKAGDEITFSYVGVPNVMNTMHAGQKVDAKVTVLDVKEVELATKEQIKAHFKSLYAHESEDFTDERFEKEFNKAALESLEEKDFVQNKDKLLKAIEESYSFDVPELYLSHAVSMPEDKKAAAIKEVRRELVLRKYYDIYKPKVSEQDLQVAVYQYSIANKIPFEYVAELLKKNNNFKNMIIENLILDTFVAKAIKTILGEVDAPALDVPKENNTKHHHHEGCNHDHSDHDH